MMNELFEYDGAIYPTYLKTGDACQFIAPIAKFFCRGVGVDVGSGRWPLEGAVAVDSSSPHDKYDAYHLPSNENRELHGLWDYVFSSHCLEHLVNPVEALLHWKNSLRSGGVLFLYLPHPEMLYWQPTRNRKHLHIWQPAHVAFMLRDLGFTGVIHSERDLAWSFAVVGWKP